MLSMLTTRPLLHPQVGEPLNQINEMLVDEDLISVRASTPQPRAPRSRVHRRARAACTRRRNHPAPPSRPCALSLPILPQVRAELRELRDSFKKTSKPGLFGLPSFKNPLKEAAESIGVEWKD